MNRRHLLTIAALLALVGCNESQTESNPSAAASQSTTSGGAAGTSGSTSSAGGASVSATVTTPGPGPEITTATGLKVQDLVVGTGAEAVIGKEVSVHYTGWLTDGTQFESSHGKAPIRFPLGTPGIVQGWNEGIAGMKVGGKRKLTIPPSLGYGAGGRPPVIPPNATMVFEVELVGVS